MKQTNGVTTVISQEQSDLVTSATGGQKEPIKNGKSGVIITNNPSNNNINKTKISSLITTANSNINKSNNNNNNTIITNKNKNISATNASIKNRTNSEMICTNIQQLQKTKSNGASQISSSSTTSTVNGSVKLNPTDPSTLPDVRAKQVLKEAVDAVVNSFTKHTQGYGRGELSCLFTYFGLRYIARSDENV